MIVYSLGLFGLLWTSSDFFGHLVIFLALFLFFGPLGSMKALCQWGTSSIKGRTAAFQVSHN